MDAAASGNNGARDTLPRMDMKFADTVEMLWRQFKTGWQAGADIPLNPSEYQAELEGEEKRGPQVGNASWEEDAATRKAMIQRSHDQYARFYRTVVLPNPLPNFAGAEYVAWFRRTHPAWAAKH